MRSVTQKHLEKIGEVTFDKIFNQRLGKRKWKRDRIGSSKRLVHHSIIDSHTGFLLFKQYCEEYSDEPVPQLAFYEEVTLPFSFLTVYHSISLTTCCPLATLRVYCPGNVRKTIFYPDVVAYRPIVPVVWIVWTGSANRLAPIYYIQLGWWKRKTWRSGKLVVDYMPFVATRFALVLRKRSLNWSLNSVGGLRLRVQGLLLGLPLDLFGKIRTHDVLNYQNLSFPPLRLSITGRQIWFALRLLLTFPTRHRLLTVVWTLSNFTLVAYTKALNVSSRDLVIWPIFLSLSLSLSLFLPNQPKPLHGNLVERS